MSDGYEKVRRELVERGYLQGRIERFVLRDLPKGSGSTRTVLASSAKAAALAAPLLGALLAASTVAANRPLLGARDGAVLWAYFALLSGAVLFALDAVAAAGAGWWARRRGARRTDAYRAGLFVAAPLLVYLLAVGLRGRGASWSGADALFIAGAVAATALVAWLAGLVSLAGIVGRTGEVPDRHRRPAALLLAVLLPIAALFAFVAFVPARGRAGAEAPSSFPPPARKVPLLLVAVDGLDGDLVEALEPRGAVEHLLAGIASGSMFPKARADASPPPEVWTTIMTGMPVEAHGVRAVGASRLPGVATPLVATGAPAPLEAALRFLLPVRTVPSSGAGRRVRALWEMTARDRPAITVGFWATWPARGVEGDNPSGYVVSDRVLPKLLSGGREDRDVQPESLFARLASEFPAARDALRSEFETRFRELPSDAAPLAWESFLIDAYAWRLAEKLREDPEVAETFVYLPGLDILRTRLAARREAGDSGAMIASQSLEAYVRFLDETVFAALGAGRDGGLTVIVADPGRSVGATGEGFVAVEGEGAVAACVGPPLGDLDVAPLVLRLVGLPASREMAGRVPDRCLAPTEAAPTPIATWGRRGAPSAPGTSDYDPEMVERLKSLGYL